MHKFQIGNSESALGNRRGSSTGDEWIGRTVRLFGLNTPDGYTSMTPDYVQVSADSQRLTADLPPGVNAQSWAARLVIEGLARNPLEIHPAGIIRNDEGEIGIAFEARTVAESSDRRSSYELPSNEAQGRRGWRDTIHRLINAAHGAVNPNPIRQVVKLAIGRPSTFLDIACGDDGLFIDVAREGCPYAVGNDLYADRSAQLQQPDLPCGALLTSWNALDFPEHLSFEVSLAKCVIHHLNGHRELESLLRKLGRITSRRIIVVDIERPTFRLGHLRTCLWNRYYRVLLRDAGRFFPGSLAIEGSLRRHFGNDRVSFQVIGTSRGRYCIGIVDVS